MKLPNLDRILVNKTSYLFTSIRDSNISRGCAKILEIPEGRGVNLGGGDQYWKIQRGGGSYGKSPPWGWYGYFLDPHNDSETQERGLGELKTISCGSMSLEPLGACPSGAHLGSWSVSILDSHLSLFYFLPCLRSKILHLHQTGWSPGLKITDSRSLVMMTGQIFFSPDKPWFWLVK